MVVESGIVRTERRSNPRISAFFAVELSSEAKRGRCGVTRNASDRGLLIVTPSRFQPDDVLELSVHAENQSARLRGRIVRIDENSMRSPELWRYRLAVELDEPLPSELLAFADAKSAQLLASA
jgi:hypothetical protein